MAQAASSLAIEGHEYGVDVTAICAGPMETNFVKDLSGEKLDTLKNFMKIAKRPDEVASAILKTVGRVAVYDHSLMSIGFRLLFKFLDVNLFVRIVALVMPFTPDWKQLEH